MGLEWAAFFVSLLAIVVAFYASSQTNDLQRRLTTIEEARRAEEVEDRQKASLVFEVILREKQGKKQSCLRITNNGAATARHIDFDPSVFGAAPTRYDPNDIPIPQLRAGAHLVVFDLAMTREALRNS